MEWTPIDFPNTPEMKKLRKTARAYVSRIIKQASAHGYNIPESSLFVASDGRYQNALLKKIAPLKEVTHVILVGIGGSSLGTEAVYHALSHTTPKQLFVLDTLDTPRIGDVEALFRTVTDPKSIALVIVSKSGTTTETLANGERVLELGIDRFGSTFLEQVVFVGDPDTPFMRAGKRKKITCVPMPECIGGRYSVFTSVGMVPLTLLGVDTAAFRAGTEYIKSAEVQERIAHHAALTAYRALHEQLHTYTFFTFDTYLEKLGQWFRQLFAESIGKPTTKKRTPFHHHILPVVSTSADLHSVAQLYLGGYTGMCTDFISTASEERAPLPNAHWLYEHVPHIGGNSPKRILTAIETAVKSSYTETCLPWRGVTFSGRTPYELGAYMATTMFEVMTLAHLFGIDAFNQPNVERYKSHTRDLLAPHTAE